MELVEIVVMQRDVYLRQLLEFYTTRKTGAKEVLLAYNTPEPIILFILSRMDYIERVEDNDFKIEELSPDSYMNHPPIEFQQGSLTISLNPFYWDGCEFIINTKLNNVTFIETWARKWIDEDEVLRSNNGELSNAIHNVTIPEITENGMKFTVDFGTSTSESLMELLTKIEKAGATHVVINSFDLLEEA